MTLQSDAADRLRVLIDLKATLLVEASAGTGKTSLLAGRVMALLADGIAPRNIAAITFTDFAAGELRARIIRFVADMLKGPIPIDLSQAFPTGLDHAQRAALNASVDQLDELTCTTIHSFCLSLLRSYSVEADIDPGADVLARDQVELAFQSAFERWLNRRLGRSDAPPDAVTFMAQFDPREAVHTLSALGKFRREFRSAAPLPSDLDTHADHDFVEAVRAFRQWFDGTPRPEATEADIVQLEMLADFYAGAFDPIPNFPRLWELAHPQRIKAMRWRSLELRPYRGVGAWRAAAGKADGERLFAEATELYSRCAETFRTLIGRIATALVAAFCGQTDELLDEYDTYKRNAAVLDFDDLLISCRRLLRDRREVRAAVAERYTRILIDEFQDTDPVQAEILFSIAGTPEAAGPWQERALMPGALFMVGDPKQAIYRFRGADVVAYMEARTAIERQFPRNVIRVRSNFRSRGQILEHVNGCFEGLLGRQAAGYVALEPTLGEPEHGLPCVTRVSVAVDADSKLSVKRDAEAKAVAELCARLIGNVRVRRSNGSVSPLAAGDIALLTPGRTDVWRYEHALEDNGLPFVSQAGKNLFRRQETQDLIAIIRILANGRDAFALGALLRGPVVGLTEQELLDIVVALPRSDDDESEIPRLTLDTPPELIAHDLARDAIKILSELRLRVRSTTPFALVSEALERLHVRAAVAARSADQALRALGNINLFMERVRSYSVRGMARLAHDVGKDWEDEARFDEARVDSSGHAVDIVTIHSSKGLEWPVVIPINMGSEMPLRDQFLYRRRDDSLHWVLGDVVPPSMADAIETDERETREERERLLYVACTRAIDLLILPQLSSGSSTSWSELINLKHGDLPELDLSGLARKPLTRLLEPDNKQTSEKFAAEHAKIQAAYPSIRWMRPSDADPDRQPLELLMRESIEEFVVSTPTPLGSATRGLVLHKLMEELLTAQIEDDLLKIESRAAELLVQMGSPPSSDQAREMAETAQRTLALPAIKDRRARLVPEIPVYAALEDGLYLSGRVDAVAYADGVPEVIFDWKSDVAPSDADRLSYQAQVLSYARAIGAKRAAVIYMTLGQVHWVERG